MGRRYRALAVEEVLRANKYVAVIEYVDGLAYQSGGDPLCRDVADGCVQVLAWDSWRAAHFVAGAFPRVCDVDVRELPVEVVGHLTGRRSSRRQGWSTVRLLLDEDGSLLVAVLLIIDPDHINELRFVDLFI